MYGVVVVVVYGGVEVQMLRMLKTQITHTQHLIYVAHGHSDSKAESVVADESYVSQTEVLYLW